MNNRKPFQLPFSAFSKKSSQEIKNKASAIVVVSDSSEIDGNNEIDLIEEEVFNFISWRKNYKTVLTFLFKKMKIILIMPNKNQSDSKPMNKDLISSLMKTNLQKKLN